MEGLTPEEWKKFIAYAGGFYGNLSNYHSFGHMKFIPEISPEKFWAILHSHPKANQADSLIKYALDRFQDKVAVEVFAYDAPYTQINFPHEGGITAYFSRNMTQADLNLTQEFLLSPEAVAKGLDILNTRTFKKGEDQFLLTVGSISTEQNCTMEFQGKTFEVQFGEFASYLSEMNSYLQKALPYVANDTQRTMLEKYIESY